jgi:hypothetical protein
VFGNIVTLDEQEVLIVVEVGRNLKQNKKHVNGWESGWLDKRICKYILG